MSDTPETDAKFGGKCATDAGYWSALDLCRRMERERDEAIKEIQEEVDFYTSDIQNICVAFNKLADQASLYKKECINAREQNAKLQDIVERAIEWLIQEGDSVDEHFALLLRAELDQLKEGAK